MFKVEKKKEKKIQNTTFSLVSDETGENSLKTVKHFNQSNVSTSPRNQSDAKSHIYPLGIGCAIADMAPRDTACEPAQHSNQSNASMSPRNQSEVKSFFYPGGRNRKSLKLVRRPIRGANSLPCCMSANHLPGCRSATNGSRDTPG